MRSNMLMVLWAVAGIALAVLFFVTLQPKGHIGEHSSLLLLGCFIWLQLFNHVAPNTKERSKASFLLLCLVLVAGLDQFGAHNHLRLRNYLIIIAAGLVVSAIYYGVKEFRGRRRG